MSTISSFHARVVTGFWPKVDWLRQTPLPPLLEVARELQVL